MQTPSERTEKYIKIAEGLASSSQTGALFSFLEQLNLSCNPALFKGFDKVLNHVLCLFLESGNKEEDFKKVIDAFASFRFSVTADNLFIIFEKLSTHPESFIRDSMPLLLNEPLYGINPEANEKILESYSEILIKVKHSKLSLAYIECLLWFAPIQKGLDTYIETKSFRRLISSLENEDLFTLGDSYAQEYTFINEAYYSRIVQIQNRFFTLVHSNPITEFEEIYYLSKVLSNLEKDFRCSFAIENNGESSKASYYIKKPIENKYL